MSSIAIRIPALLVKEAKPYSKTHTRSIASQISHWAKIGKIAEENPNLPFSLIQDMLLGLEEIKQGQKSEYKFDS